MQLNVKTECGFMQFFAAPLRRHAPPGRYCNVGRLARTNHRPGSAKKPFHETPEQRQQFQFDFFGLMVRHRAHGAEVGVDGPELQVLFFLLELELRVVQLLLLVVQVAAGLGPLQDLPQLAAVEPQAVLAAFVDDHAAAGTEIDAVHQFFADRAVDVAQPILAVAFDVADLVEALAVHFMHVADRLVQQGFQFIGIEKQAQAALAALDIEFSVQAQVDELQRDVAARADAVADGFFHRVAADDRQVDVLARFAVGADQQVAAQRRPAVFTVGHASSSTSGAASRP